MTITIKMHNVLGPPILIENDTNLKNNCLEYKSKQKHTGVYIINLVTKNSTISIKILIK